MPLIFDTENMPKFADMPYWFYRKPGNKVDVIHKEAAGSPLVTTLCIDKDEELVIDDKVSSSLGYEACANILQNWIRFKERPEYIVGAMPIGMVKADELYISLLYGSVLINAYKRTNSDPDSKLDSIAACAKWLRSTDFFTCPASTQYHDSVPHGLLLHSLNVAEKAVELTSLPTFQSIVTLESAVFVALVHDWCKIGLYKPYKKNVKDEKTGQWSQIDAYTYQENRAIALGHGASSMYLAMNFFNISIEEAYAIRWHMGEYNVADVEVHEMHQAMQNYPLCHLIEFADRLACTNYK